MINAAEIDFVAVYPPIGIARVGNAAGPDAFFFASEVVGEPPRPVGGMRDAHGAIKRQAVLFRIYAKLKSGEMRELTLNDGITITWRVEVANLKAGFYQFNQAMDLPGGLSQDAARRNATEEDRAKLDVRPKPRTIGGASRQSPEAVFDDGAFYDERVTLGELRTDEAGRLVFLGGLGRSGPRVQGTPPDTFANNDGWHDDICDGPVRATVAVGDASFEATPGYVVVAPPNYAPGLFGVVTMDDVVREVFFDAGWRTRPSTTSFTRDVWPFFQRLTSLQWVNHGLFVVHGAGSPLDAQSNAVIDRLRDASADNAAWRGRVLALVRDAGEPPLGPIAPLQIPEIYGDAYGQDDGDGTGIARLRITRTMHEHLVRWVAGDFENDWNGGPPPVRAFEALTAAEQVESLERVALYECLGGPFHPGIELSWPMRARSMWASAYRLALVEEGTAVRQDFGATLTPATCVGPNGPLVGAGPGSLTRWMGVPWQTDEASCNSAAEYEPTTFLSMPSYWGARVPDQVLSTESWSRAIASENSSVQRLKHLGLRSDWLRDVRGRSYEQRIQQMVTEWWTLGIVTEHDTPPELIAIGWPAKTHVETGRHPQNTGSDPKRALVASVEQLSGPLPPDAGPVPPAPYVPPRRRFRRGEI
jgi:hypothetical protein